MTDNFFLERFNCALKESLKKYFSDSPGRLREACEYALLGNGKRVRPYLMYLSSEFLGVDYEEIFDIALSVEYIHSYSLVHDDLPCMDNDDFRRGKPTVHKVFGETIGLLCGDSLLNSAFEILFDFLKKHPNKSDVCSLLARCAGNSGMIGGQVKEFLSVSPDFNDYKDIAQRKTGGLIYASIMAPAIFLGKDCPKNKYNALSSYAENIGLLFQLTDDYLDKIKKESLSAVNYLDDNALLEYIQRVCGQAVENMKEFGNKAADLIEFCNNIATRTV